MLSNLEPLSQTCQSNQGLIESNFVGRKSRFCPDYLSQELEVVVFRIDTRLLLLNFPHELFWILFKILLFLNIYLKQTYNNLRCTSSGNYKKSLRAFKLVRGMGSNIGLDLVLAAKRVIVPRIH